MRPFFGLFNLKVTFWLIAIGMGILSVVVGNMVAISDGLSKGNQNMIQSLHKSARQMHDYAPPK